MELPRGKQMPGAWSLCERGLERPVCTIAEQPEARYCTEGRQVKILLFPPIPYGIIFAVPVKK